jgi:hypothetical protein
LLDKASNEQRATSNERCTGRFFYGASAAGASIIASVKKELRPVHDNVTCDVCGRTMLKGERAEPFLAPGRQRHQVCELCFMRAEHSGWIRESAAGDTPARVPRPEPRRPLLGRLRRRRVAEAEPPGEPVERVEPPAQPDTLAANGHPGAEPEQAEAPPPRPRSRPKDPRHVRAVPTTAEVKVERALELFNGSDHQRTMVGLTRSLGMPWVTAVPDADQASAVTLIVAWELSWYRFRVDLGDEADPVALLQKGEEVDEIEEPLRHWNGTIDADGRLVVEQAVVEEGSEG